MQQTKQQVNSIDRFLMYYSSNGTKKIYRCVLNKFFATIKCDSDEYFRQDRNYDDDISNFAYSIKDMAPKTFSSYVVIVKQLFIDNDITLKASTWKKLLRLKTGTRALTQDKIPTTEEFKRILAYSDTKMKALLLTLASSGMRIGEATQIKIEDVDFDNEPVKINLKAEYTKTKDPRITFISNEAAFYLKEWLKNHDSYLQGAVKRLNLPGKTKNVNDDRAFPFTTGAVNSAFQRLLRLTGLDDIDPQTKRHIIHIHVFRKWFYSKLRLVIPEAIVQTLIGHRGYLTDAYARHDEGELAEQYTNGMQTLTVFEGKDYSEDIKALEDEIKRRDEKIERIEGRMDKFSKAMEAIEEIKKYKKEIKGGMAIHLSEQLRKGKKKP